MRYVDCLVNHEMIYLTSHRVIIGKNSANCSISLSAKERVITLNSNWSIIAEKN